MWQNGQKAEELVGASKENLEKMVAKYSARVRGLILCRLDSTILEHL